MDQAEASGKTVDDALSRALNMIGASRADLDAERVEMQVLDEGRKGGLFGRGARDAVVRVVRVVATPAAPASGGERSGRGGRRRGGGGGEQQQQQQAQKDDGGQRRGRRGRGGSGGGGEQRSTAGARRGRALDQVPPRLTEADFTRPRFEEGAEEAQAETPAAQAPSGRGRRGRGGGGEQREQGARRESRERHGTNGSSSRGRRREEEPEVEPDINAEEVDFAARTVDDLLRLLNIDGELTIREPLTPGDGRGTVRAVIDISGDDLGLLIGRRGETLLSLQYLVNLIVTRQFPGRAGVSIDVEHYRHRREGQVVALAQRMADRVRQTGSPITLEPMSAAERRLVHIALADDPDLVTNSVGEGENRKVVISARR